MYEHYVIKKGRTATTIFKLRKKEFKKIAKNNQENLRPYLKSCLRRNIKESLIICLFIVNLFQRAIL